MDAAGGNTAIWCDEELSERFRQLTALLKAGERFWRHHAFQYVRLPWEAEFSELSQTLRALSLENGERLARDDKSLFDFLAHHHSSFVNIAKIGAIGRFDAQPLPEDSEPRDIPGRKWQQIRYFAPNIPDNNFSLMEWCAGKSHLGRMIARERGCRVTALEYNAELVDAGIQLAARDRVVIDFHRVDAMADRAEDVLEKNQNAIALHACGDLHARLLRLCAQKQTATITLAPCCYHLMHDESCYLLSQIAKASGLHLQRDDLRTAVQGSVTVSATENRRRRNLQAWRLGFDVLQRDVRGCDAYLPAPSLPVTVLKEGFAAFCRRIAQARCIELPDVIDYAYYERAGEARLREVTALDLPRIAFRRALELWLVLDRAHFLNEQGYRVQVGSFCPRALTPRNLLIRAAT